MKKGSSILLLIFAISLAMVLGIFVGRNLQSDYAKLPDNDETLIGAEQPEDYRLDINTATKVQLMELPGIGEETADRIIAYRTEIGSFKQTDDLLNIECIGEKKLLQIESLIRVGG